MTFLSKDKSQGPDQGLTLAFVAGRVAYAVAVIAAPKQAAGPWLGEAAERGGGRVGARGLVARDALIAIGLGVAARRGQPTRPWLATLVASDLSDIAATVADRANLPQHSAPATVVVAGAAALAGAALYRAADA
jgi:hypothetical protein